MIVSMTGFATKSVLTPAQNGVSATLTIAIKSLNSRFFETSCKMPSIFFNLENQIIKILKKRLFRGHIYCTIQVSNSSIFSTQVIPCIKKIESYVAAITDIKKQFGIEQPILLDHLLRLPDIFDATERPEDQELTNFLLATIDAIAEQTLAERIKEGAELLKDINEWCTVIEKELVIIEREARDLLERQKEKIQKMVQEIAAKADEQHLADVRKAALYATLDKMDINEEIVRFKVHLQKLQRLLTAPFDKKESSGEVVYEKGKQLDFILQELAREVNTISAKCADAVIGSSAINIKVAVEKIREQVQNIV